MTPIAHFRLFALAVLTTLLSCESSETIQLAPANDQFILIDHAGGELTLSSPKYSYYTYEQTGSTFIDRLEIKRASTDGLHLLELRLDGADLRNHAYPEFFGRAGENKRGEAVQITYTTYELDNDPICPHLVGEPTKLDGTIYIDRWTDDGIMSGTFVTTPDAAYQITGSFRVLVP